MIQVGVEFDDSEIKALMQDTRGALGEERGGGETGEGRVGFPTEVSNIVRDHFVPMVRQNLEDSKVGTDEQRRNTNEIVYYYWSKGKRRMKSYSGGDFDAAAPSLKNPENTVNVQPQMIGREIVKTSTGFMVGVGNIKHMDKRTMSPNARNPVPIWRVLEYGAKASGPYSAIHRTKSGKPGWIATYDVGQGLFRMVGRSMKGNPARKAKKFFGRAILSVQQGELKIIPMIHQAIFRAIERAWTAPAGKPIRRGRITSSRG